MEEQRNDVTEQTNTEEKKKRKRGFRLTGCLAAKITAFFLLIICAAVGVISGIACYTVAERGWYVDREAVVKSEVLQGVAYRVASTVRKCLECDNEESALSYLKGINAEVAMLPVEEEFALDSSAFLWQSYARVDAAEASGFYSNLYADCHFSVSFSSDESEEYEPDIYIYRVFFNPEFPIEDDIRQTYELNMLFYELRFVIIGIAAGSVLLFFCCFIFLLCSAGHKNGREGIVPGVFYDMHFDVLTAIAVFLVAALFFCMENIVSSGAGGFLCGVLFCVIAGILAMLWLMDFAVRLKLGKWWKHTLVYIVLRAIWHVIGFLGRGTVKLLSNVPSVIITVAIYLGICILELLGIAFLRVIGGLGYVEPVSVVFWLFEKIVLLFVVLYIAQTCRMLLMASRELAEGREDYCVDTSRMFGAFREHGKNLNSLGQGISKAVAERMRSEHLKTELITNVSHDLKTPLTSIINYADLICAEETENPKIEEYSQVLLRQSRRLKKLLEDLVEASKATTGNLEVNPEPCEIGVLLTQAVGEYQQRMEEKGLELRDSQPEQPVKIMADGRHLWRVFDNLLNNICKYAQENSRVYLSVEQRDGKAYIIFRNMSKYALDVSAEELEERFVRGDKSRHMEGNGLGLSIAKSLTELQKGTLDIVIDGDLFKVIITFEALSESV